jgi:hypothetical protein
VNAEAFEELVVWVPGLIHPWLDPGAFSGPLVEVATAPEWDPSQSGIGLILDGEADWPRMAI